ncbi:MAG TPA: 3-dehydroquinate synthase [Cytophagaceae bacterium]|jgi:3-dehydroquinate synthase
MSASEIIFSKNIAQDVDGFLSKNSYSSVLYLSDENTHQHCLPLLSTPERKFVIKIESGEEYKTLKTCEAIWQTMTDLAMDRKSLMVNIGGGVIGDMGGFCAATYKRGIDFVQIPTTLLSQVDASVGGKLGIDFNSFKNHIGVFKEPQAVFIYPDFLKTLSKAELRSGFAEIIKHCLIADKIKWKEISKTPFESQVWEELIFHSVAIKTKVTQEDPEEKGLRKILNFGHTVGHAIESYFLNIPSKRLLHGEAIAIGMICEAFISYKKDLISKTELDRIQEYIVSVYGKVEIFEFDMEKILPLTIQDKKNENNQIQCTLLEKVGKALYNAPVTIKEIRESIFHYTLL